MMRRASIDRRVVAIARRVRRRLVCDWFDKVLTHACGEASGAIFAALRAEGIACGLADGWFTGPITRSTGPAARRLGLQMNRTHSWIRVGRRILDVTATQYGAYPAVWFPADGRLYQPVAPEAVKSRFAYSREAGPHYVVNNGAGGRV